MYLSFINESLLTFFLGELELSNFTVVFLAIIGVFVFLSVGLSSLKLVQALFQQSDDDE